jgi:hypothetical protein
LVIGSAKLSSWSKDGEGKHWVSAVADQVLALYQVDKPRRASRPAEEPAEA